MVNVCWARFNIQKVSFTVAVLFPCVILTAKSSEWRWKDNIFFLR